METIAKTTRMPSSLLKGVRYRTNREGVDESTSLRQLLQLGLLEYGVQLYREGKVSLREAAEIGNVSVREMLELLSEHGVTGNITYDTQKHSLEIIKQMV